MIYRLFLLVIAIAATVAYALAPPAANFLQSEGARILFFHAPEAMLCTIFFFWAAIMAARYLISAKNGAVNGAFDNRSLAAIEVGFILCSLATVTGAIFAYEQWGIAWDWDPRQVTIFVQLMIYAAYFALRGGFSDKARAAANSAAYAIFAFLTVPFLIFVIPRMPQLASKHAAANTAVVGGGLDPTYRAIFYSCVAAIGLVAVWCYKLRVRQADLAAQREDSVYESSLDSATATGVVRPVRLRDPD